MIIIGASLSEPHTSGLAGAVAVYVYMVRRYVHIPYNFIGLFNFTTDVWSPLAIATLCSNRFPMSFWNAEEG